MSHAAVRARALRVKQGQKAWKYLRSIAGYTSEAMSRMALRDGVHDYTYGLMFREWERYASVFSALGMTHEQGARVGILGSDATEVIFACYGLNMVGAQVSIVSSLASLRTSRITHTIEDEHLTDFIVTDDIAQPYLVAELLAHKKELGLRNVILLHVQMAGPATSTVFSTAHEAAYRTVKSCFGAICMDTLMAKHDRHPVCYAPDESDEAAFILHTSGTTSGMGKPIALSDKAFNAAAACFFKLQGFDDILPWDDPVCGVAVDLSNAYGIIVQVHVVLAMGGTLAVVPGGILNSNFYKAIPEFRITLLFCVSALLEHWIKMAPSTDFDLSSMRCIVMGGAAVSAHDKRRYREFMEAQGAGEVAILNGYGISELGGACCLSSADVDDESLGHLLPGVELRVFDEDTQQFLAPRALPQEGTLYLSSPSIVTPSLDGVETVTVEMVGRKPFVCTNDLVRVDEDGRITYLGRANRYFVNDGGVRYESGRVEADISRQAGIESCGVVPVYHKWTHDTIPMLCVKPLATAGLAEDVVRSALLQAFVAERTLDDTLLPYRVMIVDELPRNANGKVDLYKISHGEVAGPTYEVKAKRRAGELRDIRLVLIKEEESDMIKDALAAIASDVKETIPFVGKGSEGESGMNQNFNPMDAFNAMNQMGSQTIGRLFNWGQPAQQGAQEQQSFMPQGFPFVGGMGSCAPNPQQVVGQVAQTFDAISRLNLQTTQMALQLCEKNCEVTLQMIHVLQQALATSPQQQAEASQEQAEQAESVEDADEQE